MIDFQDAWALLHPAIAVTVVFPLLGIVLHRALLTRQRRLITKAGGKSKIPPVVGTEHVETGKYLSASVVGVTFLGLAYPIFSKTIKNNLFSEQPLRVLLIIAIFVVSITSFILLFRAKTVMGQGVFSSLTGAGLIFLGCQPEIYRREHEWFVSHFYYGILVALLMILSLATIQHIYQDRQNRWRSAHIIINSFALFLFIGQGITGVRDLLEIPLHWQMPYVYQCDSVNKTCPQPK
jgi:FtsH-binding integral membrane protein